MILPMDFEVSVDLSDCLSIRHRQCGAVLIDGYTSLPLGEIIMLAEGHQCSGDD